MLTLFKNIKQLRGILPETVRYLRGHEMDVVNSIDSAYIIARDGIIEDFGPMERLRITETFNRIYDLSGSIVTPTFCDSHTHIVYAGSRQGEFVDKINGLSYEEIARRGGGILNSADRLADAPIEELYQDASRRLHYAIQHGTGAIEIKSGYGLSTDSELKMLEVIRNLKKERVCDICATFLGAHAVGRAFAGRQSDYVEYVISDMIPAVAVQNVAQYVDVFCDRGFFTPEETSRIIEAASVYGMRPKIHANELAASGGVQVGVAHNALSVDHLERAGEEELRLLSQSETVATMLPGASFFLGMPYAPASQAIDHNCIVALASDWNPGSSPSGSMPFIMSLGCIKMKLTPEQSFNAVTINGAAAMGLSGRFGSITRGKVASFIVYKPYVPDANYIPYAYSEDLIDSVFINGELNQRRI